MLISLAKFYTPIQLFMMKYIQVLLALVSVGLFSANVEAETQSKSYLLSYFTPQENKTLDASDDELSEQLFAGDVVAEKDDVTLSYSDIADLTSSVLELSNGSTFTITAETFKNIHSVIVRSAANSASFGASSISAKNSAGDEISISGGKPAPYGNNNVSWVFSENLSEVTFTANGAYRVIQICVSLDITPLFSAENGVTVYADEVVPFQRMTNAYDYMYSVAPVSRASVDNASVVPNEGIKLTGHQDGEYDVTVNVIPDEEEEVVVGQSSNTLRVNYKSSKESGNTVSISNVDEEAPAEYYDLQGRKLLRPRAQQLHFRKTATKTTLHL